MTVEQRPESEIEYRIIENPRAELFQKYPAVLRLFSERDYWLTDPYTDERFTPKENLLPLVEPTELVDGLGSNKTERLLEELIGKWEEKVGGRLGGEVIGYSDEVFYSAFEVEMILLLIHKRNPKLRITEQQVFSGVTIQEIEKRSQEKLEQSMAQMVQEVGGESLESGLEIDIGEYGFGESWGSLGGQRITRPLKKEPLKRIKISRAPEEELDATSLYLKEMSITPLLTFEEEISLAKRIEGGKKAENQLSMLSSSAQQRDKQGLKTQIEDGLAARDHMIKANTRLVVSIAKKHLGRGVPLPDLIQEGNLGLIKAANKYDHRRGFRFSTYATWWIRQTVTRSVADLGRTIRIPVHMNDRLRQLYKTVRGLEQELGRPPKVNELAEKLEMPEKRVAWMLQVSWLPLSLESPVGDDEDSELGDFIPDEAAPQPSQTTDHKQLSEKVEEVLSTLGPREAKILRLRFGLDGGKAHTLEQVGEKYGLTRERIRQIEGKALRRLRHPMRARQLREHL